MGRKGEMKKTLGDVHGEVGYETVESVNLPQVLADANRFIAGGDSVDKSVDFSALKRDYEAMIAKNKKKKGGDDDSSPDNAVSVGARKTAADLGSKVDGKSCLKAVREHMGPFNWCLFKPTEGKEDFTGFVNAGSLSLPELVKSLDETEILFGLIRMGFGIGRFRRTKYIGLSYTGPKVGIVKKAKATGARTAMKAKLGAVSIDLEVSDSGDLTLTSIIEKIKRATAVDGDGADGDSSDITVDSFLKALEEEAAANAAFFGDSGKVISSGPKATGLVDVSNMTVDALVKKVKTPGDEVNWAVFAAVA